MSSFKRQIIFTLFTIILFVGLASIVKHFSDEKQQLGAILESQVSQMSHRFSISISEKIFYNKDEQIVEVQNKLNRRPRKVLGYKTPAEVFFDTITKSYVAV